MERILIAALSTILIFNASTRSQPATNTQDEDGVKELITAFADAWKNHDAKAFSLLFTEDADFTNVVGKRKKGRAEIEAHHKPGFETKWKNSYQKITPNTIRFIKPDVAK